MDLRLLKQKQRNQMKDLSFLQLQIIYKELTGLLNKYYMEDSYPTQSEIELFRHIKRHTRIKVYQSVWIGKRCADMFIPYIASSADRKPRMRGLVIEVNGGIHNQYNKMLRDETFADYISSLNIGFTTIENMDVNHYSVTNFLLNMPSFDKLDFRASKRVWRSIYLETIRKNEEVINKLGSISAQKALEVVRRIQ